MKTTMQEKAAALKTKLDEIKKFWDENAAVEVKDFTEQKKQEIDRLNKEAQDLNDEIEQGKGYEAARAKQEVMRSMVNQPVNRPEFANTDTKSNGEYKSSGRQFVEDPAMAKWIKEVAPGVNTGTGAVNSPNVELKVVISSPANSGGAFVRRDYAGNVDLPLRQLTIADLISHGRTGSNLVEYVRTTAKTRAAAITPEVTDTSGSGYTAGAKPQSSMAFQIIQEPVKTIAVWMPITRQIMMDAPQLESLIDNFEREDLLLALEDEMITGTGGTHFTGLENTPGITPHPRVAADTDLLVTTRKARTTAMIVARAQSTGFLFNPYDWQDIDLLRNATAGNFYFGGPVVMGTQQLWGLPVAESEVIPQGTAYTGNLKSMMLWDREQPTRRISDSHSDFFTHNLLAILTEGRWAFGVTRPAAIVKIDLLVGANS